MEGGGQRVVVATRSAQPLELERIIMTAGTILLIIVVLLLLGALPSWPHSRSWGYYPSGGLGTILIILIILLLMGKL